MKIDLISATLKNVFGRYKRIHYVVLFGSAARKKLRANSDIDVMVGGSLTFNQRTRLMADLEMQLKRPVDIMLSSNADSDVALSAFAKGIPIIVHDESIFKKDFFRHYYHVEDAMYLKMIKAAKLRRSFNGQ